MWYVPHIVHPKTFGACDCLAGILYKGCQKSWQAVAMAAGQSETASASRVFCKDDLADLCEALHKVSTKYTLFGLQIGLKMHELRGIAEKHSDSAHCLLEILSARLNQESALTCADVVKALKSPSVGEHSLAIEFPKQFENTIHERQIEKEKESSKDMKAAKSTESDIPMLSEKQSEDVEGKDESKSDESEKSAEVERQVHERDEPKSKRAKKRAHKKEKLAKSQCASEQPEPDEYKEYYESKEMKLKQKQYSEMAASPQSGAESKSVKESEKIAPEIMSTDSENKSFDACKENEMLFSKTENTGKVRESGAYSEVKHQPQSAKIREVKNEARKKGKIPEKEGSTEKQHSVLHRKTAVAVESDEGKSEQLSHKSKKKLEAEETESEESFSESTSDESETESPEKEKPKSPTDTEEMCHYSDEEIEKVRAKDKKKMPQKSKVATAKSSPHSERLVEEEQYKQKKGKRSVEMKEQERESELRAKASRGKLQRPHSHSQVKERERVKEIDSGMKAKRLVGHSSEQASDESETDSENEESDSGNDSSEDGEDSEGKSSDEEEKRETDEEASTSPSEEEVKKEKEEKSVFHKKEKAKKECFEERKLRVSKAIVEQSKYDSPQGGRWFGKTHTRKVKGERESEAASLKYDSPGDDEQSDPGHGSRDQEEHGMSPTAIGSSSPSTSQEEKKKQPVSKKQGHRKKHVRKMKEERERMKRGKEKAARSSGTDDSSPECNMAMNQYEGEMKELVNIFERFFGKLCRTVFDPKDVAAELQSVGLISKSMMRDMMLSPESQQAKIIALVDALDKMIKFCPDCLFVVIEVMLKNEALQETAREILRETGIHACALHFVNPRRACAARVVCVCVCLSVCLFKRHLTSGTSVRPETAVTYSAGKKVKKSVAFSLKKNCGISEIERSLPWMAMHKVGHFFYG